MATYTDDPDRQSAGAALAQVQRALRGNVRYLHGGWQTIVDGLAVAARVAGARIVTEKRVVAFERDGEAVRGVRLDDGTFHPAAAVVLALSPADAARLAPESDSLCAWAADATPIMAACLDIGLRSLPRPDVTAAFGIDRPLYLSVHSAVADVAPPSGATIHVAQYLRAPESDTKEIECELEAMLDCAQPGWRELLVRRRFLPHMTIAHLDGAHHRRHDVRHRGRTHLRHPRRRQPG